jgi:translation initiation factor 5A
MSDQEDNFDAGDAGSSFTIPTQAGSIKKGGYCMLQGHPCKVTEYSTAKPTWISQSYHYRYFSILN